MTKDFSGYLTFDEVCNLINHVPSVSLHADRDLLLVQTLWETGGRVSEVITLRENGIGVTSLNMRNLKQVRKIKIETESQLYQLRREQLSELISPKSEITSVRERQQRTFDRRLSEIGNWKVGSIIFIHDKRAMKEVEVSAELCQLLKAYCQDNEISGNAVVFCSNNKAVNRQYVWRLIGRASEAAGIRKLGKVKNKGINAGEAVFKGAWPHSLRHSLAMYLYGKTKNIDLVKQQLGHKQILTTNIYAKTPRKEVKEIIATLPFHK